MLDSNCFRHPQFLVFRPPLPLLLCSNIVVRSPFYHHNLNSVLLPLQVLQTAGAAAAAAAEDEEENGSDGLSNLLQSVVQGAAGASTAPGEDDEENETNGRSQLPSSAAAIPRTEELRYRGTRRYSHNHRSVSFLSSH